MPSQSLLHRSGVSRTHRSSAIKREVCHTILGNSFSTNDVAERRTMAQATMLAVRTISHAPVAVHTRQAYLPGNIPQCTGCLGGTARSEITARQPARIPVRRPARSAQRPDQRPMASLFQMDDEGSGRRRNHRLSLNREAHVREAHVQERHASGSSGRGIAGRLSGSARHERERTGAGAARAGYASA